MYSFAHLSDVHLGFQKTDVLRKIEQEVFENALDECIKRKVNFILMPGDLFHNSIPEMRVARFAFRKFRQVHEARIPVYVVYGSHDFSPVSNSVIDLLVETGYLIKVSKQTESQDDKISLEFTTDSKTSAKIVGLPGLKAGKELEYYEKLDRKTLESEPGFKIFLFHAGLSELKSKATAETDFMPVSMLPKGFDYYAGGHMHTYHEAKYPEYGHIVFPGTLFSGYYSDLEENARGQKRGFVFVEFDKKIQNVEFVAIENVNYELVDFDADKKSAKSANEELFKKIRDFDPANKVVIIKIYGELVAGKTTDIDFSAIRDELKQKGALQIEINRNQLLSKEYNISAVPGKNKTEIETNVFKENIGQLRNNQNVLLADSGVSLAKKLLIELAHPKLENEKTKDYQNRLTQTALQILELRIDDS